MGTVCGRLIRGEVSQVRPYACSLLRTGSGEEWALRTLEWAFFLQECSPHDSPRRVQLFAKPEDRWEVNDVSQHHQELAEEMEKY